MKCIEGLLDLADGAKTLVRTVNDVLHGEIGNAGGIKPLSEETAQLRRRLASFGGGLRVLLGESFKIFDGGAALSVFVVEVVQ